jgi:hypothetical protein
MPTSISAIRGLRCQTISKTALQDDAAEDALPPSYQLQRMTLTNIDTPEQEMAERVKVRKRLIIHAILMYADTVLYCPPLIYMVSNIFLPYKVHSLRDRLKRVFFSLKKLPAHVQRKSIF